jgi:hypothetical protein
MSVRGKPSLRDVIDLVRENQEQIRGHGVILEEMRAQNRATFEAVEANRVVLEGKIDGLARETGGRLSLLEGAVRQNSADIRKNSEDIQVLTGRVDALGPLDQRVSRIEQRVFRKP